MKYFSEKTKKMYDKVELLQEAEKEYDKAHEVELKKIQQKKDRAKEIEKAYNDAKEACNKYNELVNKFIEDYGSYHISYYTGKDETIDSILEAMLKIW